MRFSTVEPAMSPKILLHRRDPRLARVRDRFGSRSARRRAYRRRPIGCGCRCRSRSRQGGACRRGAHRLARLYALERQLRSQGYLVVAGVDEVGRGAIAGPLTAGACVLPATPRITGVDDSKRLTPSKRRSIALSIKEIALCWSVAHVPPEEIDSLGISAALRRAMGRALAGLELEPDHVVVDGLPVGVARLETAVVKGDSKVAAIAAASVLAKVERDDLMTELARAHPGYGFEINKGYGTSEHLEAVARFGLSPAHRRSFSPGGGTQALF